MRFLVLAYSSLSYESISIDDDDEEENTRGMVNIINRQQQTIEFFSLMFLAAA